MKRRWFGAELLHGMIVCKCCGSWNNRMIYSRSFRGRTFEVRECACGNHIVMIEKEREIHA